ncbi:hypothetical protein ACXJJ3_08865 [Kribbella sp. WER1]|uniref:hypothetical protein n=1 Tax=Kribbella sp. NPDC059898 TaxID=3346995 RepID=UPI003647C8C3
MDDAAPDYDNNLVAAGGVLMLLLLAQGQVRTLTSLELVTDAEGNATNQLDITLSFLRSPYRLTVTRITEEH